ncbi:hypothetical protein [[Mycoplasma] mobile]|uniref:Uncharacterized protein n=1 Tax=Mycoplasma mobile (strain ATCC 43663 / 163K / NCTC 11711) TaxID=267748 RepID=Q6KHS6_MYCM1|nr:hypothetical protein [[Mycoplasma] mobile]AAT27852.1 hypothetical protein MMOB3660 [Mycoplasma mobile 163K]
MTKNIFANKIANQKAYFKRDIKTVHTFLGRVNYIQRASKFNDEKRVFRPLQIELSGTNEIVDIYLEATTYISKKALDEIRQNSYIFLEAKWLPESNFLNNPLFEIQNIVIEN